MRNLICLLAILLSSAGYSKGFYDLSYESIKGKKVSLSDYKGKVMLIVNTASMCGYTSQYEGLESLYKEYKSKGLVVVGFPSDSFNQEYADDKKIADFCKMRYGVSFPLASKSSVKGSNTNDVFKYLIANCENDKGQDISWNFNKFLVDKNGKVVKRYSSSVQPESMELKQEITMLLKAKKK
jgi:glutathione peroxidase